MPHFALHLQLVAAWKSTKPGTLVAPSEPSLSAVQNQVLHYAIFWKGGNGIIEHRTVGSGNGVKQIFKVGDMHLIGCARKEKLGLEINSLRSSK